jgi:hypothetical protein
MRSLVPLAMWQCEGVGPARSSSEQDTHVSARDERTHALAAATADALLQHMDSGGGRQGRGLANKSCKTTLEPLGKKSGSHSSARIERAHSVANIRARVQSNHHVIAKGLIRQSRRLESGGRLAPLHMPALLCKCALCLLCWASFEIPYQLSSARKVFDTGSRLSEEHDESREPRQCDCRCSAHGLCQVGTCICVHSRIGSQLRYLDTAQCYYAYFVVEV